MANNQKMKAFVRYDGTGKMIPGSLILRRKSPGKGWVQIQAYECCDPFLLTTTTTTTVD